MPIVQSVRRRKSRFRGASLRRHCRGPRRIELFAISSKLASSAQTEESLISQYQHEQIRAQQ
jgi:hypothetical protein